MTNAIKGCFGCGAQNPIGLKLKFREEDGIYITNFTARPEHQGYEGLVHGGIISTLLDEVMTKNVSVLGITVVTARLDVSFLRPTPIGQSLTARGRIIKHHGRVYEMTGEIRLPDDTITAEGNAVLIEIKEVKG